MPDFVKLPGELQDWRIVLDILIFSALFFTIYKTLKVSGTWKIAMGLVVAAFASMFASILDLRGVEWLFTNLSQVAVIALLIIFQPEVRRFLEQSARFGGSLRQDPGENLASLLDEVLFDLSQRRWGALMVLPGRNPMQQWLTEGVRLDAYPSQALLLSIFDPDSPGHDGAILIDKGKVARFGMRLPLSATNTLPPQYGTRHHAALGLAEKTDALVAAVSEERGTVSLFYKSSMIELKKRGDFKDFLRSHEEINPLKTMIHEGAGKSWKTGLEVFGSLVLATLFWFIVISGRTDFREMYISVPIEYSRPPADLILAENRLTEAKLQLEGPATLLDGLNPSQIRLKVDLSEMAAGRQVVNLAEENVELPKKINLLDIYPPNLNLELYKLTFRMLPVKPQFIGELETGYRIESIEVNPALVEAGIPEEEAGLKEILTTPIYLQGLRGQTTVYCKIVAPYGLQPKDRRWPDISVKINVVPVKKVPAPKP